MNALLSTATALTLNAEIRSCNVPYEDLVGNTPPRTSTEREMFQIYTDASNEMEERYE